MPSQYVELSNSLWAAREVWGTMKCHKHRQTARRVGASETKAGTSNSGKASTTAEALGERHGRDDGLWQWADDTLAEWLRRRPAKPLGSARVGSNPTGVVCLADGMCQLIERVSLKSCENRKTCWHDVNNLGG